MENIWTTPIPAPSPDSARGPWPEPGALKNAVHKRLRQLNIKEFRLGQFGEGDSGVTVVTFK